MTGLLCCCVLLTSVGCATLQLPFGKDRMQKASASNPVMQIVCIWQPSEGRDPNGIPCRGFAGQILFLAGRNSLPVQVDGDVRIYLFDDQGTAEEQAKPIHQYDFDSLSWAPHLTNGTLGPTYSVFVPYTRRGTYEANCALRVRLKTGNEVAVFSDLASIPLGGRTKATKDSADQIPSVEEAKATTDAVSQTMRRTTTISRDGETVKPNAKSGRTQAESMAARAEEASGRVQLANYEVGAESNDPSAQRMEQLEQLVQQLLEQQNGQKKGMARREEPNPAASTTPTESLERNRHRLTNRGAGEAATDSTRTDRPASRRDDDSESTDTTAVPSPLTSDNHARHPLSDFEAEDAPPPIRTAAKPRHESMPNHPLAALDEELSREDTFAQQARKPQSQPIVRTREESSPAARTIRASEQSEHRERSWSDAFEPIDTEAMETTSVEADASRRQRLRAAR
ncbi:MAG: hypothetical protein H7062_14130 [Candidatus Saccharimonas sp.]|nr:hypothetical protein [Planctomycetaceae bacterium]